LDWPWLDRIFGNRYRGYSTDPPCRSAENRFRYRRFGVEVGVSNQLNMSTSVPTTTEAASLPITTCSEKDLTNISRSAERQNRHSPTEIGTGFRKTRDISPLR